MLKGLVSLGGSIFLIAVSLVCAVPDVNAQTVNPTRAEFGASADHNAVANGVPVVSGYQLELFLIGAQAPFQTVPFGKPSVDPDGVIRLTLSSILVPLPTAGINYSATVAAVGPGGLGRSAPSNTFTWAAPPTCTYATSPSSQPVGTAGGTFNVTVTAGSGCAWTATENLSWLSISSGAAGSGNGTVSYSVTANSSTSTRSGTLTVAGQNINVTQSGITCTYTVSPSSQSMAATAGTATATVTTASGCSWTATDNQPWITITSGGSGSGNGTVSYSVTANTGTTQRSGALTIATATLAVVQSAPPSVPAAPTNLRVVSP